METVKSGLRDMLAHPARRVIVIIVTFVAALVTVWPAADLYNTKCRRQETLRFELDQIQQQIAHWDELESQSEQLGEQLRNWKKRTVSTSEIHQFRGQLVEMARQTRCQVRRLNVTPGRQQPWRKHDDPTKPSFLQPTVDGGQAHPYQLATQHVSLTVSGAMQSVRELLARMHAGNHIVHTKSLSINPSDSQGREVTLKMELILYDLVRKPILAV